MKLLIVENDRIDNRKINNRKLKIDNRNEEGIFGNCNYEIVVEKLERGEDIWKL